MLVRRKCQVARAHGEQARRAGTEANLVVFARNGIIVEGELWVDVDGERVAVREVHVEPRIRYEAACVCKCKRGPTMQREACTVRAERRKPCAAGLAQLFCRLPGYRRPGLCEGARVRASKEGAAGRDNLE